MYTEYLLLDSILGEVFDIVERYASKRKESRYRLENRLDEQTADMMESEPSSQALELHS